MYGSNDISCLLTLLSCHIRNINLTCMNLYQVWLVVVPQLFMILFIIQQKASYFIVLSYVIYFEK